MSARFHGRGGRGRWLIQFANDDRGAMLIEFSLSVWTLFLMTFLIFEFCMTVYTYSVLGNAAREGVRYAIVHGTDSTSCSGPSTGCSDPAGNAIIGVVNSYASVSFHDISNMTVTPSWPDGASTPSSRVVVSLSYSYVPYLNLLWTNPPLMQITAEGRIVY